MFLPDDGDEAVDIDGGSVEVESRQPWKTTNVKESSNTDFLVRRQVQFWQGKSCLFMLSNKVTMQTKILVISFNYTYTHKYILEPYLVPQNHILLDFTIYMKMYTWNESDVGKTDSR